MRYYHIFQFQAFLIPPLKTSLKCIFPPAWTPAEVLHDHPLALEHTQQAQLSTTRHYTSDSAVSVVLIANHPQIITLSSHLTKNLKWVAVVDHPGNRAPLKPILLRLHHQNISARNIKRSVTHRQSQVSHSHHPLALQKMGKQTSFALTWWMANC